MQPLPLICLKPQAATLQMLSELQNLLQECQYRHFLSFSVSTQALPLLNPTLRQAALNTSHHIRRDLPSESINISTINIKLPTRTSKYNLILQPKVVLGNLAHAGILIRETCNEHCRLTIRIKLRVDRALRKDRHLELAQRVVAMQGAILSRHAREQPPFDDDVQLRGAGVHVWGVEAASGKEADGYGAP